jgi:hypothetical protein
MAHRRERNGPALRCRLWCASVQGDFLSGSTEPVRDLIAAYLDSSRADALVLQRADVGETRNKAKLCQLFVFLPDNREIMSNPKMVECMSNTTQAVSAVQSLASVVLLFLIGLALRNRFRMK